MVEWAWREMSAQFNLGTGVRRALRKKKSKGGGLYRRSTLCCQPQKPQIWACSLRSRPCENKSAWQWRERLREERKAEFVEVSFQWEVNTKPSPDDTKARLRSLLQMFADVITESIQVHLNAFTLIELPDGFHSHEEKKKRTARSAVKIVTITPKKEKQLYNNSLIKLAP